jgi:PhnB protein
MLAGEFPEVGITAPATLNGTSFTVHLHVDDADAAVCRAVDAGAEVTMEPTDHFYGERTGVVRDPFGHRWTLGHSIEDVSLEEMQRRYVAGDSD